MAEKTQTELSMELVSKKLENKKKSFEKVEGKINSLRRQIEMCQESLVNNESEYGVLASELEAIERIKDELEKNIGRAEQLRPKVLNDEATHDEKTMLFALDSQIQEAPANANRIYYRRVK